MIRYRYLKCKGRRGARFGYKDRKHPIEATIIGFTMTMQFSRGTEILADGKDAYSDSEKSDLLDVFDGVVISDNALVRSDAFFEKVIQKNAGTIGLDLETYGMYYAARFAKAAYKPMFIFLKSVSDYGSHHAAFIPETNSLFRRMPYAYYTPVQAFLRSLLRRICPYNTII
jgi:hypothetical protein